LGSIAQPIMFSPVTLIDPALIVLNERQATPPRLA